MNTLPQRLLIEAGKKYPRAWRFVDTLRADRGKDLPDWPRHVFLPMAGWYATACYVMGVEKLDFVTSAVMHELSALGTWRVTQDIVRFDADLYTEIASTPMSGNIPTDVLFRIPAWCVWVDTPLMSVFNSDFVGFFAFLEHDVNNGNDELRICLTDEAGGMRLVILHVGPWDVQEALDRAWAVSQGTLSTMGGGVTLPHLPADRGLLQCLNLLLYLCAYGFVGQHRTSEGGGAYHRPNATRTKNGWRLFPPERATIRTVGEDIGDDLRRARGSRQSPGRHNSPRPHIRRAHWHGYWSGAIKGRDGVEQTPRRFDLKWLPPIAVALSDKENE